MPLRSSQRRRKSPGERASDLSELLLERNYPRALMGLCLVSRPQAGGFIGKLVGMMFQREYLARLVGLKAGQIADGQLNWLLAGENETVAGDPLVDHGP